MFFDLTNLINITLVFKIIFLIIVFLYIVFTFVIFNQIRTMEQIVSEIHASFVITFLSIAGILAAVMLFVVAFVIL